MANQTESMKAAVIREFGDFDVLKLDDVDRPKPGHGRVLVKVLAAGVNRFDHYIREGSIVPELPFPHVLGGDAVGEVAELGQGVEGFGVGERVIVVPGYPLKEEEYDTFPVGTAPSFTVPGLGTWGTYAQYMEVPAPFLLKDDTGRPPEQIATLPMALATSVRALKEVAGVRAGDKVLVQAGASGSGSMQVQVARALGAQVATTIRKASKEPFVRTLGADLIIDTSKKDFVKEVQDWTGGAGADVVIDNLGGEVFAKSIEAARPLGTIVAFGFAAGTEVSFDVRSVFFPQKQIRGSMASDARDLRWGLEQVKAGRIKPGLDHTLPLREAAEAHRLIAKNQVAGSLVLLPWAA
jgi:NADPH:quinone reductase-like Zn-dependent oxidoreductase